MPNMPFCRLTGTCVRCAREKLDKTICEKCPDKEECDKAIHGLSLLKLIEERISMILPDLVSLLQEEVENVLKTYSVPNPEEISKKLVQLYMAITSTLLRGKERPAEWLITVLRPEAIRSLTRLPLDFLKLSDTAEQALDEYASYLGVDSTLIRNLLKFMLIRYILLFKNRGFEEFLRSTFTEIVVKAFEQSATNLSSRSS